MVSINTLTHDDPKPLMVRFTSQGFQASSVAENVAQNNGLDVVPAHNLLISDPPHLNNVIGKDFTHFGIGCVKAPNGKVYWTQHFAKSLDAKEPCSATSPPVSAAPAAPPAASPGAPPAAPGASPAAPGAPGAPAAPGAPGVPAAPGAPAAPAAAAPAASAPPATPPPGSAAGFPPGTTPMSGIGNLMGGAMAPPPPYPYYPYGYPMPPCTGPECSLFNNMVPPIPPPNYGPFPDSFLMGAVPPVAPPPPPPVAPGQLPYPVVPYH